VTILFDSNSTSASSINENIIKKIKLSSHPTMHGRYFGNFRGV
jgi:hypothetical protein